MTRAVLQVNSHARLEAGNLASAPSRRLASRFASLLATASAVLVAALGAASASAADVPVLKAFKYYRLNYTKTSGKEFLQIAELALYDRDGNRINLNLTNKDNVRSDDWVARLNEPNTCALLENGTAGVSTDHKHATQMLFDGSLDTKAGLWNLGKITPDDATTWPAVIMRLADDAPAVAAYNLATGNDNAAYETAGNGRTLIGWTLDASDDGVDWVRLDRQDSPTPAVPSPVTDKTWYNGGQPLPTTDYSGVQYVVGPNDTLAVDRSVALQPVVNNGTVSIAQGITASLSVAADDVGLQPGGALTGAGTLEKRGAGELRIGGDNRAFAGKVAAKGGTVRFVDTRALHAYAYYRLMLRKKNGGDVSDQFELGEVALYDANGERINLNLDNVGNSKSVSALTAGSFSFVENGSWAHGAGNNEAPEKLFDGDLQSKMYSGGFYPTAAKCPYVLMRLADGAPAVASYRLGMGNDVVGCPNRQIVSWSLEGSDDGALWTTLHSVTDDPHMKLANSRWFNGGSAYPVMVCKGCKARYYRFSVTGLYSCGGYEGLQFSELALYDAQGNRVNLGLAYRGEDLDLAQLGEKEATFVRNGHSSGAEGERTDKLFDGNSGTKGYFSDTTFGEGHAVEIVMRLADDVAAVAGYNVCTGNDDVWAWGANRCRTMGSWKLEASDDGATWTTLANETDSPCAVIANQTWFNQGTAFPLTATFGNEDGASAPTAAILSVSDGARIVLPTCQGAVVSGLEIDCTAAAGTFENFIASPTMTLNLVNYRAFSRERATMEKMELPVAFAGTVDLGDTTGWTVQRDGVAAKKYVVTFEDGKLYVIRPGSFVLVQ